ncbi:MAG: hypothetical protein ACYC91_14785 [Solirubrobacteraceae bacterium]
MTPVVRPRSLARVQKDVRTLIVEVISLGEPLKGIIRVQDELDRSFVGWLGLLSALQDGVEGLRGHPSQIER